MFRFKIEGKVSKIFIILDPVPTRPWYVYIIGKPGAMSDPDDGIYIFIERSTYNCASMNSVWVSGQDQQVIIKDKTVAVRDYGRGLYMLVIVKFLR
jgi:hypothetical protein